MPVTLLFCGCIYCATSMAGDFGIFWIAYFLAQLAAIGVAFTFAALSPTIHFANGVVLAFGGTLMYFVGYLLPLDQIPKWWIW